MDTRIDETSGISELSNGKCNLGSISLRRRADTLVKTITVTEAKAETDSIPVRI